MKDLFCNYKQSLALKGLGFDEACLSYYRNDIFSGVLEEVKNSEMENVNNEINDYIGAPLKQQAINWFEENHSLFVERIVTTNSNEIMDIEYYIKSWRISPTEIVFKNPYDSFDKNIADSICIDKLIEIITQG